MARSGARACSPCLYCSLYCKSDLELPPLFFVMETIPVPLIFLFPWLGFFKVFLLPLPIFPLSICGQLVSRTGMLWRRCRLWKRSCSIHENIPFRVPHHRLIVNVWRMRGSPTGLLLSMKSCLTCPCFIFVIPLLIFLHALRSAARGASPARSPAEQHFCLKTPKTAVGVFCNLSAFPPSPSPWTPSLPLATGSPSAWRLVRGWLAVPFTDVLRTPVFPSALVSFLVPFFSAAPEFSSAPAEPSGVCQVDPDHLKRICDRAIELIGRKLHLFTLFVFLLKSAVLQDVWHTFHCFICLLLVYLRKTYHNCYPKFGVEAILLNPSLQDPPHPQ